MKPTQTEEHVWKVLLEAIKNPPGVAGLMGNLYAESAMNPQNLQQSFEKKLGTTDEKYTKAVDNGTYKSFVSDGAGYGLAQWTYSGRKRSLLEYAQKQGKSIGDLDMQLEFLLQELTKYSAVMDTLKKCKTVEEASEMVMLKYEMPADQSEEARVKRKLYGERYLDAFQKTLVLVTGETVWIRTGDSTEYPTIVLAKRGVSFEYAGTSLDGNWYAVRVEAPTRKIAWISKKYSELSR